MCACIWPSSAHTVGLTWTLLKAGQRFSLVILIYFLFTADSVPMSRPNEHTVGCSGHLLIPAALALLQAGCPHAHQAPPGPFRTLVHSPLLLFPRVHLNIPISRPMRRRNGVIKKWCPNLRRFRPNLFLPFCRRGVLSEAALALEAAVTSQPGNAEAWRLLGTVHAENDDDQQVGLHAWAKGDQEQLGWGRLL